MIKIKKKINFKIYFYNFLQNNKLNIILALALLVSIVIIFAIFEIFYWKAQQQTTKLQKSIQYLESTKHEIQNLQKTIYVKYPKIDANIKNILEKIKITNSNSKKISISKTESKISLFVDDITNEQLIKLIFELENTSPTLIIKNIKVDAKNKNKLKVALEILGLD